MAALCAAVWFVGIAWIVVRHPYEGRIVLALTGDHGVHLFDPLGVLVPVALTLVLLRLRPRRSSRAARV